jgi:hypothetical protein
MSKALRARLKRRPTEEEVDTIFHEMTTDSDRGSALLAASMIEDVLKGAIAFHLRPLSESEESDLFQGTSPLSTFSAKIKIAYAMGIIGKNSRHDLETIKEVRNAFAHGIHVLKFDDPEIAPMVKGLHGLKDITGGPYSPKINYTQVVRLLMLVLTAKMKRPPLKIKGIDHLD